jgi:MscS family membrane protein
MTPPKKQSILNTKQRSNFMRSILLLCLLTSLTFNAAQANPVSGMLAKTSSPPTQEKVEQQTLPPGPEDEFNRGVPQASAKGFADAIDEGDFEKAVEYMDLRNLPKGLHKADGPELAKKFKIVLDRTLWIDLDAISAHPKGNLKDGLPSYREKVGQIKAGNKTIDILLQRVPRGDGVYIWKISNRTVGSIPLLYEYHGYTELEEYLESIFPDVLVFGWHSWQWASWLVLIIFSYLLVWMPTWLACRLIKRPNTLVANETARFVSGPLRWSLWVISVPLIVKLIGPSPLIHKLFETGTFLYLVITWAVMRMVDLWGLWFAQGLDKKGKHAAQVLLKPIKTVTKVVVILTGLMLWLDNLGVHIGTLLASLGIGGFALALAAQDLLKNLLGSIMILMDRPYVIGQRIVAKGHDGVVEEIGLRSTKIRLLTGHQVSIPNEDMAKIDIENIGRRPHIRRHTNIAIPLDTPVEKIEQAVNIIRENIKDHECMNPAYPPRVFFNEFNRDSINITLFIWYRSTDYWAFQAFNEKLNLRIKQDFEAAGIEFALPSFTANLAPQVNSLTYQHANLK